MAGSFSDYLENKVLDHIFGGADFVRPATLYFGLSTTAIADNGTGITEPVGSNYSRAAVANNATNFPAAANGQKVNGAVIDFPLPSGPWGTVTYFFISDAASGGNILASGDLTVAQPIVSGNPVKFEASSLTFTLN